MAGAEGALSRLQEMLLAGIDSADGAALAMGEVTERAVRSQLSKSSHPLGTPTPSAPGSPPAMISGRLRDSVTTKMTGNGTAVVGGTAPYSRIHQFGGYSGRNHATRTPARPYLEAAWDEAAGEAYDAAIDVIVGMVYRG